MDIVNLLITLASGLAGGNVAGAAMQDKGLGTVGNSVTGVLGGGAGHYIMQALNLLGTVATATAASHAAPEAAHAANGLDLSSLITNIAGSGVGGAVLTAAVALIKNALNKA